MSFAPQLLRYAGLIADHGSNTPPPLEATQQPARVSIRIVNRLPDHASVAPNG